MSDYTEERWAEIKALRPSPPRWVHVAVAYATVEVPDEAGVMHKVQRRILYGSYKKKK